jgi:hypothetical protein
MSEGPPASGLGRALGTLAAQPAALASRTAVPYRRIEFISVDPG